jgi:hypothetical protein
MTTAAAKTKPKYCLDTSDEIDVYSHKCTQQTRETLDKSRTLKALRPCG